MADIETTNTQLLPTPFVDKITLTSTYANNVIASTKVDLLLSLKANKSANTNLFSAIGDSNNLLLKVIQVTDEDLYSFMSISSDLVYYACYQNKMPSSLPIEILQIAYNRQLLQTRPSSNNLQSVTNELKSVFQNSDLIEIKTVSDFSVSKEIQKIETLDSGEEVLNTYFRQNFEISLDTSHVSYFTFCDYDETKFQGVDFQNQDAIKVNCEVVFNRSKLVSQTYTYSLENGKLWTGYVHRDPATGQWKTNRAKDNSELKRNLIRNIYYNTKIQDFRVFDKLEKAPTRSQNISEALLLKLLKVQFAPKKLSPIQFETRLARGIKVVLNAEKLLQKHSILYPFISQLQLENYNWIKDIRIFRKRVKKQQNILQDFTKNEIPIYLPPNSYRAESSQTGILEYYINDPGLANITTGMYCYGIEFTFTDNILEGLKLQLNKLKQNSFVSFINRYYRESLIPSADIGKSGSYIMELDSFTDSFIAKYRNRQEITQIIEVFIESYNKISSQPIENTSEIKQNLLMQITPETANPKSILSFLNTYNSIVDTYEKYVKISNSSILKEEAYFSNLGQQLQIAIPQERRISGNLTAFENSVQESLKTMSEKLFISFEQIEPTTGKSTPLLNKKETFSQEVTQDELLDISDAVSSISNIISSTTNQQPINDVFMPSLDTAVRNVKEQTSRNFIQPATTTVAVSIPTPPKQTIIKETPKITASSITEQPVNINNIQRNLIKVPTPYATTGKVSSNRLEDVVTQMLKTRRNTLLRRRG